MNEKPIAAKITDVTIEKAGKLTIDRIHVQFLDGRDLRVEQFTSPMLNGDNLSKWRRVMLTVILGKKVPERDQRAESYEEYKAAINGKGVHIAFNGQLVFAIGREAKYMFFPDMYGLFDIPGVDFEAAANRGGDEEKK